MFLLQGSQCCLPWFHSAHFPGCAPTSHTYTPSLVSLAWPPNMATAALVVPRESGPLSSYLPWTPWKTPWSPHRPSSCPPWMPQLRVRREPCWRGPSLIPTTQVLPCQILNGWKKTGSVWRRRRRGRWKCCLLAGKLVLCTSIAGHFLHIKLRDLSSNSDGCIITTDVSSNRFQVAQIPEHKPTIVEPNKTSSQEKQSSLFLGKTFCSTLTGIRRYDSLNPDYGGERIYHKSLLFYVILLQHVFILPVATTIHKARTLHWSDWCLSFFRWRGHPLVLPGWRSIHSWTTGQFEGRKVSYKCKETVTTTCCEMDLYCFMGLEEQIFIIVWKSICSFQK